MKTLPLFCLLTVLAGRAFSDEKIRFDELPLEDGTALKNAVVLKVEPDGVRVEHSAGVSKVKFEQLPESVQKQFSFDRGQAEKFREEKAAAREALAATERKARVEAVLEQRRSEQDDDVQRSREAFYDLLESGEYSYPQLDKSLLDSISILKEADRRDLAVLLEDDRKLLRERELLKPADKYRLEREQLQARIRDLENQVAQLNNAAANPPGDNRVATDAAVIPFFVDRPIVIDRPVVVDRPSVPPAACPPGTRPDKAPHSPPSAARPPMPAAPTPYFAPASPRSAPYSRPSVPSMPVALPSGGAQQQGAHLWKK